MWKKSTILINCAGPLKSAPEMANTKQFVGSLLNPAAPSDPNVQCLNMAMNHKTIIKLIPITHPCLNLTENMMT